VHAQLVDGSACDVLGAWGDVSRIDDEGLASLAEHLGAERIVR
jgi:hypothetical protein